jgi:2-C-methyl-D-erythritol 4-phosphate cytidylyltransferase
LNGTTASDVTAASNVTAASKVCVILVAAGSGVRLGAGMPKAFAPLCGEPLLAHALRGALGCAQVEHVVIVAPPSHVEQSREVAGHLTDHRRVDVVIGGVDRLASVAAGLEALCHDDGIVLVHDVARCLAPPDLFVRVIDAVRAGHPAVVPGLPVSDTVKVVDGKDNVLATPDRESLRGIQTPQGFLRETLEHAHANVQANVHATVQANVHATVHASRAVADAVAQSQAATDDAGLVERTGGQVRVVAGDHRALKITSPFDLAIATALLQDGPYGG